MRTLTHRVQALTASGRHDLDPLSGCAVAAGAATMNKTIRRQERRRLGEMGQGADAGVCWQLEGSGLERGSRAESEGPGALGGSVLSLRGGFAGRTAASGLGVGRMLRSGNHCWWEKGDGAHPVSARVQDESFPLESEHNLRGRWALLLQLFVGDRQGGSGRRARPAVEAGV